MRSDGSALGAATIPIQYDAQRFVGFFNYLALNTPAALATVQLTQVDQPQPDRDGVSIHYTGYARANGPAQRAVEQAASCLGALRDEVYRPYREMSVGFQRNVVMTFPVGIAFLDQAGQVVALDLPSDVRVYLYDANLGNGRGIDNERRFEGWAVLPRDVAAQVVRYVPVLSGGGGYLSNNGYACQNSGECFSSTPMRLDEVRLSQAWLRERFEAMSGPLLRDPGTFGTLDASQVGRFCVR